MDRSVSQAETRSRLKQIVLPGSPLTDSNRRSPPQVRALRAWTIATRWGREDSNLRRLSRRVYSPFPLAARAHPQGGRALYRPLFAVDVSVGIAARSLGPRLLGTLD